MSMDHPEKRRVPYSYRVLAAAAACLATAALLAGCARGVEISVDPSRKLGKVSPLLFGSQIPASGTGCGTLVNSLGEVKGAASFNPYLVQKAQELGVTSLRFWGDIYYHWRAGVGPMDSRPAVPVSHLNSRVLPDWYGTDEFLSLCRLLHAEPIISAPYIDASPATLASSSPLAVQAAANWVEYVNGRSPGLACGSARGWEPTRFVSPGDEASLWVSGRSYHPGQIVRWRSGAFRCRREHTSGMSTMPGDTGKWEDFWEFLPAREIARAGHSYREDEKAPAGYFAWLRERFGHRDAWGVKYWEIGNEVHAWDGRYQWARADEYARAFSLFARAMKAVDPGVRAGIVVPGRRPQKWPGFYPEHGPWMLKALGKPGAPTEALKTADFIVWHVYAGPKKPLGAGGYGQVFDHIRAFETEHRAFMRDYPKPAILTEVNVRDACYQPDLGAALVYAAFLNQFARLGVQGANQIYLGDTGAWYRTQGWRMIFEDRPSRSGGVRRGVSPQYLALQLYARYAKGDVCSVTLKDESQADVLAVRSASGDLHLLVINPLARTELSAQIRVRGVSNAGVPSALVLAGKSGASSSNEDSPDGVRVSPLEVTTSGGEVRCQIPASSLAVVTIPSGQ